MPNKNLKRKKVSVLGVNQKLNQLLKQLQVSNKIEDLTRKALPPFQEAQGKKEKVLTKVDRSLKDLTEDLLKREMTG